MRIPSNHCPRTLGRYSTGLRAMLVRSTSARHRIRHGIRHTTALAGQLSRSYYPKRPLIDIGRPSRAFPVTPPGIRVPYHGGSEELCVQRIGDSGEAERIEVGIGQRLLDGPRGATSPRSQWDSQRPPPLACGGTPRRLKLANRVGPVPHCRQITIRSLRRIRASRLQSTRGSWLKPK